MKKKEQRSFEDGPPPEFDEVPFPESEYPEPRPRPGHYELDNEGKAAVTPETEKTFDMFRCPYCGERFSTRTKGAGADNEYTTTVFTCPSGDQWEFVRDVVDGKIQEAKGYIKGLNLVNGFKE